MLWQTDPYQSWLLYLLKDRYERSLSTTIHDVFLLNHDISPVDILGLEETGLIEIGYTSGFHRKNKMFESANLISLTQKGTKELKIIGTTSSE